MKKFLPIISFLLIVPFLCKAQLTYKGYYNNAYHVSIQSGCNSSVEISYNGKDTTVNVNTGESDLALPGAFHSGEIKMKAQNNCVIGNSGWSKINIPVTLLDIQDNRVPKPSAAPVMKEYFVVNLQGQYITKIQAATDIELQQKISPLPKGVYIINHRKILNQ